MKTELSCSGVCVRASMCMYVCVCLSAYVYYPALKGLSGVVQIITTFNDTREGLLWSVGTVGDDKSIGWNTQRLVDGIIGGRLSNSYAGV